MGWVPKDIRDVLKKVEWTLANERWICFIVLLLCEYKKTALVLGAGGFIAMVKRLKSEGYWVRGRS